MGFTLAAKRSKLATMTEAPSRPDALLFLPQEATTGRLGAWFARHLVAGDCMLLSGPIGAGKSHFARALIQARLGRAEDVPSPSFTLVQTYQADDVDIWHADLYRLRHPDEVMELGLEQAMDSAITLIEWPDRLGRLCPTTPIRLDLSARDDGREARLWFGGRTALAAAFTKDWPAHG